MECQICKRDKLCFWCKSIAGATVVACIDCAIAVELRIIEEVLEVKSDNKGVEEGSSSEG